MPWPICTERDFTWAPRSRGDALLLVAQLEWPTAFRARSGAALTRGLHLLRSVFSDPVRVPSHGLDPDLVETERRNLARTLRAQSNNKSAWAVRRCVATLCEGEPHAASALGDPDVLPSVTPLDLARLHASTIRRAPVDVYLVADLAPNAAVTRLRNHLLWPRGGRLLPKAPRPRPRPARTRVRRVFESADVAQSQLVLAWRGAVRLGTAASRAAGVLSGLLGPGSYGRLFQVVREEHGLCYSIGSSWNGLKAYQLVRTGTAPEQVRRADRLIRRLVREVGAGQVPDACWSGFHADLAERVRALGDSPAGMLRFWQDRIAHELDPSPSRHGNAVKAVRLADVRRVARRLALDTRVELGPS